MTGDWWLVTRDETKRLGDIRLSYRHFERQREIFAIRGQVVDVWECSNGKPAIQGTFGHCPVSSS